MHKYHKKVLKIVMILTNAWRFYTKRGQRHFGAAPGAYFRSWPAISFFMGLYRAAATARVMRVLGTM